MNKRKLGRNYVKICSLVGWLRKQREGCKRLAKHINKNFPNLEKHHALIRRTFAKKSRQITARRVENRVERADGGPLITYSRYREKD